MKKGAKTKSKSRSKKRPARTEKPVLIVQHAPHEHPAMLLRALITQGIPTLWIHPYLNEAYPKVNEISGLISMGGPMGANDEAEHAWIQPELKLMKAAVEGEIPTVGICLGGQMMAKALGGKVEKHSTSEIGWFEITINSLGQKDPILTAAGDKPTVYHWHGDTFHLPLGAELLASSEACARQAYRIEKHAYGFQFHPEADHQLVHEWLNTEGVDEDIAAALKVHGSKNVQDAGSQKTRAARGEKSSLTITSSIANLFRKRKYEPIDCEFHDHMESWSVLRKIVTVELNGKPDLVLKGRIITTITVPGAEFLILQDEKTLLWPIRMDDIKNIQPT